MALTQCKECKKEVSTSAKKCPHCGVDNPAVGPKQMAIGCLALVVLVGACYAVLDMGGSEGSPRSSEIPTLDAAVRRTPTQLVVTNQGNQSWTDCEISINPGLFGGGWTQRVARIGAGESVQGGLMAFTRSGGERFNPVTHEVQEVTVYCHTARGRAIWSGAF